MTSWPFWTANARVSWKASFLFFLATSSTSYKVGPKLEWCNEVNCFHSSQLLRFRLANNNASVGFFPLHLRRPELTMIPTINTLSLVRPVGA